MKKKSALIALAIVLMLTLTACSKTFQCGLCLEEKTGRQYQNQYYEDVVICHDCYSEIQELTSLLLP